MPAAMAVAAHGVTHPGHRSTNEDAMVVDGALGLFIVADGMGGHNAGEVASALAARTIHEFITANPEAVEGDLVEALRLANDRVLSAAGRQPQYAGMGTTVVAAYATGNRVVFGSVGDSRIYLWRDGALTQLTTDDSWVSRVLLEESLTAEDAQRHPMRHVLTNVVGLREDMDPAVGGRTFERGDVLLLCSDGLHGVVGTDRIAESLGNAAAVEQVAQLLIDEALRAGAMDNVTVIVVRHE